MPDHRTLASADVHEPKWITTATTADTGKVITPSSSTSGISELRKLTDRDLNYSDPTKNIYGWNDISDSLYTSGAPLAVASGVRTLLPNNAAGAQTTQTRLGALWQTGSSQFLINDLNAFYVLQISMTVTAAAAAGTPYVMLVELESANGPTVIRGETRFIKGGGYVNKVSPFFGFYNGSFINNQALKLYVTPDTNVNIYSIGFVLNRTYKES